MQPLYPIRSNESPAPTTAIAATAPVPSMEPLEPPSDVPPFQPLEPFEPTEPIWPVAPVHLAQPVPSVPLVQPQQPMQVTQLGHWSSGVSLAERASMITYLVLGVVEALIVTRVILKLLAANPGSGFARFIYTVSAPLVAPFQGIFSSPATQNSVLELSSLVAIAVYALIAWGIVRLIAILGSRLLSSIGS